jgi:hypothetical protein
MFELNVAALLSHLLPSVFGECGDDIPTSHDVYKYTLWRFLQRQESG